MAFQYKWELDMLISYFNGKWRGRKKKGIVKAASSRSPTTVKVLQTVCFSSAGATIKKKDRPPRAPPVLGLFDQKESFLHFEKCRIERRNQVLGLLFTLSFFKPLEKQKMVLV